MEENPQPGLADYGQLGADQLRFSRGEPDEMAPIPPGPLVAPQFANVETTSRLPAAGERMDDGLDDFLGFADPTTPPAPIPASGRSLIAPAMLIDCNSGLVAVVEVPGSPTEAVTSFDPTTVQAADPSYLGEGSIDGTQWGTYMFTSPGGYALGLTATATDHGTSLVLATECGD